MNPTPSNSSHGHRRERERGVALVVTLIMLSLITVLAVAFLALTRRERASVTVTIEQTDARFALDHGFARVQSDILTRLVEGNSFLAYDLMMSTNFDIGGGLVGVAATNNVSYFNPPGTPDVANLVTPANLVQVISNLLFDPRPPVFVETNAGRPLDFRFYLDLNRNQTNDPTDIVNGRPGDPHWVGVLSYPELPHSRTNKFVGRYAFIALPESKSLDQNFVHNYVNASLPPAMSLLDGFSRNQGLGNWEYNLAGFLAELNPRYWVYTNYNPISFFGPGGNGGTAPPQIDAFLSAKELLAYRYGTNSGSLLSFDLAGFPNRSVYPGSGAIFETDNLDGYANGPLMYGIGSLLSGDVPLPTPFPNDNAAASWPGSPNSNQFFSLEELVDRTLQGRHPTFSARMRAAMDPNVAGQSGNDLNTFYRMVSQMGMDSALPRLHRVPAAARDDSGGTIIRVTLPNHDYNTNDWLRIRGTTNDGTFRVVGVAPNFFDYELTYFYRTNSFVANQPTVTIERNPKVHLNFDNFRYAENEFIPWGTNKVFFMVAADRMLRGYTNVGFGLSVTNIEIFPANQLNARTFQILKQVANIADWRENRFSEITGAPRNPGEPDFPAIYWPRYSANGTNRLWISDFNIVNFLPATNARPVFDPNLAVVTNYFVATNNFFATGIGVPWIVGAEKGYPNFNESLMRVRGFITRKLGVFKASANQVQPSETNQMYIMQLDPQFSVEAWNSYSLPTTRDYRVTVEGNLITLVTNDNGVIVWPGARTSLPATRVPGELPYAISQIWPAGTWVGAPNTLSFLFPGFADLSALPMAQYFRANQIFVPVRSNAPATFSPTTYPRNEPFYIPDWTLVLTNRLRVFMEDMGTTPPQLVDAVNITLVSRLNVAELLQGGQLNLFAQGQSPNRYWDFNRVGGGSNAPYRGIIEQMTTSTNVVSASTGEWSPYFNTATFVSGITGQREAASNFFDFLTSTNTGKISMQTPFNPYTVFIAEIASGVNDPLVHYLPSDFREARETNWVNQVGGYSASLTNAAVASNFPSQFARKLNRVYEPWGGNREVFSPGQDAQPFNYDVTRQDPMVRWSSEWLFPTDPVTTNYFGNVGWLGRVHRATPWQTIYFKGGVHPSNQWVRWGGHPDNHPTNDWALADLFTTAIDPNSQRGMMSINQTNRAAWAAVLSGVSVLRNTTGHNSDDPTPLPNRTPEFITPVSPAFDYIWTGIETNRRAQPAGVFSNLAALFTVPEIGYGTNTMGGIVSGPYAVYVPPVRTNDPTAAGGARFYDVAGLDDVSYERIPQQVLSLLKVEEQPRFAVYLWGQSLKPADRSILLNNALAPNSFGLCTNYQITGEVAAKAIVRVDRRVDTNAPAGFRYNTVIESYQLLPNP